MPSRPARPQLGLFDNPVGELEEVMRGVGYRRFKDGPRWRGLFIGKAAAVLFE